MSLKQTLQGIKARLAEAEAILANQPLTQDYQHQTLATLCSCLYALTLYQIKARLSDAEALINSEPLN